MVCLNVLTQHTKKHPPEQPLAGKTGWNNQMNFTSLRYCTKHSGEVVDEMVAGRSNFDMDLFLNWENACTD